MPNIREQTQAGLSGVTEVAPLGRRITLPFPETPDQLDLSLRFVTDLALKALSIDATGTTASVSERIKLGLLITDTVLQQLYREHLIEVKGSIALHNNRYAMLERGWARVSQLMAICSYVGPSPVTLELYSKMIVDQMRSRAQSPRRRWKKRCRTWCYPTRSNGRLASWLAPGAACF